LSSDSSSSSGFSDAGSRPRLPLPLLLAIAERLSFPETYRTKSLRISVLVPNLNSESREVPVQFRSVHKKFPGHRSFTSSTFFTPHPQRAHRRTRALGLLVLRDLCVRFASFLFYMFLGRKVFLRWLTRGVEASVDVSPSTPVRSLGVRREEGGRSERPMSRELLVYAPELNRNLSTFRI
jgi:hypothetical protein